MEKMVIEMTIETFLEKKKFFEFYILNINKDNAYYNDIIQIFKEAVVNAYFIEEDNHVIILSTVINNDINQLVNALIEDFGIKLKVFKSNKIYVNHFDFMKILKDMFLKYEDMFIENYISLKSLLLMILEKNIDDLAIIKPIIMNNILNDSKLLEIINAMFVNDLNVCKTANYVYMHRNTINNKITIIKEETGLDIQKFQDAVILYALVKK